MKYILTFIALFTGFCLPAQFIDLDGGATRAVVVGISDYQDKDIPDLRFADRDAEAFANFLRSPAGGSLDGDHLKVLIDSQATVAQFAIALDWLMEVTKEGDEAIIYFSGHGDVEKKTLTQPGFLLCWDAPSRVYMAGGALALPMLQEVISTLSIQNKAKVVVITDACRSGKLAGNTVGGSQATTANLTKQFANEIKILSCQPNEYSIEGEQWGGGRGAFSFNLVNALYGLADGNNDLFVTLQEVGRYLEDHVTAEVAPVSQVPMVIGNRTERLANVNANLLAAIRSGKTSQMLMLSPVESRGLEDDVLAGVDTTIRELYRQFKKSLKDKVFLAPTTACADAYYGRLIAEPKLERLHSTMRRNYAAALQDEAQQVMNTMLKTGLTLDVLSGKKASDIYGEYPALLNRAAELLGIGHYIYATLQARKSFFEGKIQQTRAERRKYFQEALGWQPDLPHAYVELVSTCLAEEVDTAVLYATRAMEISPNWVVPYIRLSAFYGGRLRDFEKAAAYLEQAGQVDSASLLVWYSKANFYRSQGDFEKAEYWYKKAVASTEKAICFPCAHLHLGFLYMQADHLSEAEEHFNKALRLDSMFTKAYNGLGTVYRLTDRFEEAEVAYKKDIQANPVKAPTYNEMGNLYSQLEQLDKAEAHYKMSIQYDSMFFNAYSNLANVYLTARRFVEAEITIKKQVKIQPGYSAGYLVLGALALHDNRQAEADSLIQKGKELDPDGDDYYRFACVLSLINQPEWAFETLEQALKSGWKYYDWMQQDTDLAPLREQKEPWKALMKKYFPDQIKD